METNKVLSALCYFSIFFAGFLFPLVVFFVSDDSQVKSHAKKAFLSHLIPLIPIPLIITAAIMDAFGHNETLFFVLMFTGIVFSIILSLVVVIWNIIKGVKVIKA